MVLRWLRREARGSVLSGLERDWAVVSWESEQEVRSGRSSEAQEFEQHC